MAFAVNIGGVNLRSFFQLIIILFLVTKCEKRGGGDLAKNIETDFFLQKIKFKQIVCACVRCVCVV